MQDKTPRNEQGQKHGYWEVYYYNGLLSFTVNFINGNPYGHFESYWIDGQLQHNKYYAK